MVFVNLQTINILILDFHKLNQSDITYKGGMDSFFQTDPFSSNQDIHWNTDFGKCVSLKHFQHPIIEYKAFNSKYLHKWTCTFVK